MSNDFTNLGVRTVFNKTLRHLVNVSGLIDSVEKGENLADLLDTFEEEGVVVRQQIPPIISVILVSKFEYACRSVNLPESYTKFDTIVSSFKKWSGVDMVLNYYHPNLGPIPVNPQNESHWSTVHELKKDELLVVYAKTFNKQEESAKKAIEAFFALLNGKTPVEDPSFLESRPKPAAVATPAPARPAPAQAARSAAGGAPGRKPGAKNLTPKYSVQVSNELFHNGNVEAWKNIIESYETKHSDCKVIVYHEGELIQDLNSLFKWGKVKHAGLIFFQVAGHNIKNVSRLQKYLYEGASPRFEAFLKHDVNKVLNLF